MGKFIGIPSRPSKPTKAKPDRGFIQEQMPDYAEANRMRSMSKPGRPPIRRPWTKMVKKGY